MAKSSFGTLKRRGDFVCYGSPNSNGTSGVAIFELNANVQDSIIDVPPHRNPSDTALLLAVAGAAMVFVNTVHRLFPNADADDIVAFHVFKIDASYIEQIVERLPDASPLGIKSLWGSGVSVDYIEHLRSVGVRDLNWRSVIELKNANVPDSLPASLKSLGYQDVFVDELLALHKAGVTQDFIEKSRVPGAPCPAFAHL